MKKTNQSGFTLIELMISLVLGLIVVGGVISIFMGVVKSSSNTLKMTKLNYEMSILMTMMMRDIRRAGFDQCILDIELPPTTPACLARDTAGSEGDAADSSKSSFNQFGDTALSVRQDIDNPTTNPGAQGLGECILYAYDYNQDGVVDDAELFGYRLDNAGVVEMRTSVTNAAAIVVGTADDSCTTGSWAELTDGDTIDITTLTFNLADSACLNSEDSTDCYATAPTAGDKTIEVRLIEITMIGELTNDSAINTSFTHSVRVRNDLVRER